MFKKKKNCITRFYKYPRREIKIVVQNYIVNYRFTFLSFNILSDKLIGFNFKCKFFFYINLRKGKRLFRSGTTTVHKRTNL